MRRPFSQDVRQQFATLHINLKPSGSSRSTPSCIAFLIVLGVRQGRSAHTFPRRRCESAIWNN